MCNCSWFLRNRTRTRLHLSKGKVNALVLDYFVKVIVLMISFHDYFSKLFFPDSHFSGHFHDAIRTISVNNFFFSI